MFYFFDFMGHTKKQREETRRHRKAAELRTQNKRRKEQGKPPLPVNTNSSSHSQIPKRTLETVVQYDRSNTSVPFDPFVYELVKNPDYTPINGQEEFISAPTRLVNPMKLRKKYAGSGEYLEVISKLEEISNLFYDAAKYNTNIRTETEKISLERNKGFISKPQPTKNVNLDEGIHTYYPNSSITRQSEAAKKKSLVPKITIDESLFGDYKILYQKITNLKAKALDVPLSDPEVMEKYVADVEKYIKINLSLSDVDVIRDYLDNYAGMLNDMVRGLNFDISKVANFTESKDLTFDVAGKLLLQVQEKKEEYLKFIQEGEQTLAKIYSTFNLPAKKVDINPILKWGEIYLTDDMKKIMRNLATLSTNMQEAEHEANSIDSSLMQGGVVREEQIKSASGRFLSIYADIDETNKLLSTDRKNRESEFVRKFYEQVTSIKTKLESGVGSAKELMETVESVVNSETYKLIPQIAEKGKKISSFYNFTPNVTQRVVEEYETQVKALKEYGKLILEGQIARMNIFLRSDPISETLIKSLDTIIDGENSGVQLFKNKFADFYNKLDALMADLKSRTQKIDILESSNPKDYDNLKEASKGIGKFLKGMEELVNDLAEIDPSEIRHEGSKPLALVQKISKVWNHQSEWQKINTDIENSQKIISCLSDYDSYKIAINNILTLLNGGEINISLALQQLKEPELLEKFEKALVARNNIGQSVIGLTYAKCNRSIPSNFKDLGSNSILSYINNTLYFIKDSSPGLFTIYSESLEDKLAKAKNLIEYAKTEEGKKSLSNLLPPFVYDKLSEDLIEAEQKLPRVEERIKGLKEAYFSDPDNHPYFGVFYGQEYMVIATVSTAGSPIKTEAFQDCAEAILEGVGLPTVRVDEKANMMQVKDSKILYVTAKFDNPIYFAKRNSDIEGLAENILSIRGINRHTRVDPYTIIEDHLSGMGLSLERYFITNMHETLTSFSSR
jgi:hypothetical protein